MLNLGELEDLYYAACAKLKELRQGVDLLLANGFKGINDTYFAYQNEPLRSLGPITIGNFSKCLLIHETILHSSELQSLLNKGVIEKNSCGLTHIFHREMGPDDSTNQHGVQRGIRVGTAKYVNLSNHGFKQTSEWPAEVQGLEDKSNMSCGMVFGELAEKYRPMAMNAELEGPMIQRKSTPQAPQAFQEEVLTQRYISPYNLNERAKKLNVPGGPEMPCICAPLCASDPTQNCLCEENGLFVRVTEGMNIDDLDVPDLVRRDRQPSVSSESSTTSLNVNDEPPSQWSIYSDGYVNTVIPLNYQHRFVDEVEKQIGLQKTKASDDIAVSDSMLNTASQLDARSMSDLPDFPGDNDSLSWQDRLSMRPLRMSDFTYDELRQPFSKQCDHPPRRQSVARRLFKSKASRMAVHKQNPTIDQPTQGHNINNGTDSKVVKQASKRSLADISFTGLRFTRRQRSHGSGS